MKLIHIAAAIAFTATAALSQAAVFNHTFNAGAFDHVTFKVGSVTQSGDYNFDFSLTPKDSLQGVFANFNIYTSDALGYQRYLVDTPNLNSNSFQDTFKLKFNAPTDIFVTLRGTSWGWTGTVNSNVAPVPEPETYALMGMGLVGLLAARRRKMGK